MTITDAIGGTSVSLQFDPAISVGVDVGGSAKGFHAVALKAGKFFGRRSSVEAADIYAWCQELGAATVAIDAPCQWSVTGKGRQAERDLAAKRISSFWTPSREVGETKAFYQWIFGGAELYQLFQSTYRLFDGSWTDRPVCLETFPQAVACALAGKLVRASEKRSNRRDILTHLGIDVSQLPTIDYLDAALGAVTAEAFRRKAYQTYGDVAEGFIVVPETIPGLGEKIVTLAEKPKSPLQDDWERRLGAIYFIAAGSPPVAIKIGTAPLAEVQKRLLEIQGLNHEVLELLGIVPFTEGERPRVLAQQEEFALHRKFGHLARFAAGGRKSEWFYPGHDLLEYISTAAKKPEEFGIRRSVALTREVSRLANTT